jgi:catechol 2,3-dioxygenase-like lactoylglutathione lyase family enzyme
MKATGLVYWVHDNEISVKFYKKLGFYVSESNERHSIITIGDFEITLVSIRDEKEFGRDSMAREKGLGSYLYIKVDDVDGLYEKFRSKKIRTSSQPRDWEWGNREFVVKDPDGYKICFYTKLS